MPLLLSYSARWYAYTDLDNNAKRLRTVGLLPPQGRSLLVSKGKGRKGSGFERISGEYLEHLLVDLVHLLD